MKQYNVSSMSILKDSEVCNKAPLPINRGAATNPNTHHFFIDINKFAEEGERQRGRNKWVLFNIKYLVTKRENETKEMLLAVK
jgi:hypothetical protein